MMTTVPKNSSNHAAPLRILYKGPEYLRSSNLRTPGGGSRRKTATERLEADKFKYVKSEGVRQRRFTLELRTNSPPNNDSTGTHSMGTASTGSPINIDEDYDITTGNDVEGDMTAEAIMQTMANFTKVKSQSTTPVSARKVSSLPTNELAVNEKSVSPINSTAEALHSINANRRQQRMKNKALRSAEKVAKAESNLPPSPLVTRLREKLHNATSTAGHTGTASSYNSPPSAGATAEEVSTGRKTSGSNNKRATALKSNSRALNKMKEGIKNVASFRAIMGLDKDSNTSGRQSRSAIPNHGRRYRSASAGPNILKTVESESRTTGTSKLKPTKSDASDSKHPLMSPRTQLKQVRLNLKKVKIGNNGSEPENTHSRRYTTSEGSQNNPIGGALRKISASSFVVNPPKTFDDDTKADVSNVSNINEAKLESKPPIKPKPKTEKENSELTSSIESQPKYFEVLKKRTGSSSSKEDDDYSSEKNKESTNSNVKKVRRRSLNILQSSENTTSTSPMEVENPSTFFVSTRHKRPRSYQHEQKKTSLSSRTSLSEDMSHSHKDTSIFTKSGSRKSVAEAIEEIINPVLEDTIPEQVPTESPAVGSKEENTLVANRESVYGNWSVATTYNTTVASSSSKDRQNSSVADNINNVLRGTISEGKSESNKSSNNKYEKFEKRSPHNTQSTELQATDTKSSLSAELLDSSGQITKSMSKQPSFFDGPQNIAHLRPVPMRQHSAPTGTVSSRPTSRIDMPPVSTSGAEEILTNSPALSSKSKKNGPSQFHPRTSSVSKQDDVQKSVSSGSADALKPFTALTASDLKPRSNTVSLQSVPVKAMFAYPGPPVPQTRTNPKRHTTTPVSPTLSPNKQQARMTPPHTPRSSSSTPYSSLKRTPASSRSSSLKRNRHRGSKTDIHHHSELDRFFSTMGMDEYMTLTNRSTHSNHLSSESDFSFAGASAYVRDSPDEAMDIDPIPQQLLKGPQSVSIIEKNARVMRWLMSCQKNKKQNLAAKMTSRDSENADLNSSQPTPVSPSAREPMKPSHQLLKRFPSSARNPQIEPHPTRVVGYPSTPPPPIPPRTYQRQQRGDVFQGEKSSDFTTGPKESNV